MPVWQKRHLDAPGCIRTICTHAQTRAGIQREAAPFIVQRRPGLCRRNGFTCGVLNPGFQSNAKLAHHRDTPQPSFRRGVSISGRLERQMVIGAQELENPLSVRPHRCAAGTFDIIGVNSGICAGLPCVLQPDLVFADAASGRHPTT